MEMDKRWWTLNDFGGVLIEVFAVIAFEHWRSDWMIIVAWFQAKIIEFQQSWIEIKEFQQRNPSLKNFYKDKTQTSYAKHMVDLEFFFTHTQKDSDWTEDRQNLYLKWQPRGCPLLFLRGGRYEIAQVTWWWLDGFRWCC